MVGSWSSCYLTSQSRLRKWFFHMPLQTLTSRILCFSGSPPSSLTTVSQSPLLVHPHHTESKLTIAQSLDLSGLHLHPHQCPGSVHMLMKPRVPAPAQTTPDLHIYTLDMSIWMSNTHLQPNKLKTKLLIFYPQTCSYQVLLKLAW